MDDRRNSLVNLVVILLLIAALGGCVQHSDDSSKQAESVVGLPGSVTIIDAPEPVAYNESWSVLRFQASGEPGSWVVVFKEFTNLDSMHNTVTLDVVANGQRDEPLGLFVTPANAYISGNETPIQETTRTWGSSGGDLFIASDGGSLERRYEFEHERTFIGPGGHIGSAEGTESRGIYAVIGSTGSWSVNLTVENHNSPGEAITGPSRITTGTGATLEFPGHHTVDSSTLGGNVQIEQDLPTTGWTHLEFFSDPLFYGTYHHYIHDCHWRIGNATRDCSGEWGGDDSRFAAWGRFPGEPGTALLDITYVETTWDLQLAIMHLPGDSRVFPGGDLQPMGYQNDRDFFDDERVDPQTGIDRSRILWNLAGSADPNGKRG